MKHLAYDISRCVSDECERRESCARFTTPYHADVLYTVSCFEPEDCEHFIDNEGYEKGE